MLRYGEVMTTNTITPDIEDDGTPALPFAYVTWNPYYERFIVDAYNATGGVHLWTKRVADEAAVHALGRRYGVEIPARTTWA
jgi:hypothetical protein